jgi:hypothetical protein
MADTPRFELYIYIADAKDGDDLCRYTIEHWFPDRPDIDTIGALFAEAKLDFATIYPDGRRKTSTSRSDDCGHSTSHSERAPRARRTDSAAAARRFHFGAQERERALDTEAARYAHLHPGNGARVSSGGVVRRALRRVRAAIGSRR